MSKRLVQLVDLRSADDDEANYAASCALDELAGWFLDDGFTLDDFIERCEEAYERATEDAGA